MIVEQQESCIQVASDVREDALPRLWTASELDFWPAISPDFDWRKKLQ
jgi:hypothetical protein